MRNSRWLISFILILILSVLSLTSCSADTQVLAIEKSTVAATQQQRPTESAAPDQTELICGEWYGAPGDYFCFGSDRSVDVDPGEGDGLDGDMRWSIKGDELQLSYSGQLLIYHIVSLSQDKLILKQIRSGTSVTETFFRTQKDTQTVEEEVTYGTVNLTGYIIGNWISGRNYSVVFYADGTGSDDGNHFTYSISDNVLEMTVDGEMESFSVAIVDMNCLSMTDAYGNTTHILRTDEQGRVIIGD